MAITDWPAQDRPREKLCTFGASALSDTELLAIFLRTGCAGKSAVDLARDLLQSFGSLRALVCADQASFCQAHGLGQAKYAQLQAVMEMARRYLAEDLKRDQDLSHSRSVKRYLTAQLRHQPREVFSAVYLDSQNRFIAYDALFYGTLNAAAVYPREVAVKALQHKAAAVIFAHNHPSGVAEPSECDIALTRALQRCLAMLDIKTLDHVIIGDGEPYSFAENGKM
ncbi:MAG: DNA repair protein RadC [Agarilytica sp.]